MPARDRTGPQGMGPMTGRRAGYCAGGQVPGFADPMLGRGQGRGRGGGGRGWRHQYYATGVPGWARYGYEPAGGVPPYGYGPHKTQGQEVEQLKEQAEWLKGQLDAISQRLEDLKE